MLLNPFMPVLPADRRDGLQHGRIPSMPHENLQASPADLGIIIICQDVEHGLLDLLGSFPSKALHRFLAKLRRKIDEVVDRHPLLVIRWWFRWEGLRGRGMRNYPRLLLGLR